MPGRWLSKLTVHQNLMEGLSKANGCRFPLPPLIHQIWGGAGHVHFNTLRTTSLYTISGVSCKLFTFHGSPLQLRTETQGTSEVLKLIWWSQDLTPSLIVQRLMLFPQAAWFPASFHCTQIKYFGYFYNKHQRFQCKPLPFQTNNSK